MLGDHLIPLSVGELNQVFSSYYTVSQLASCFDYIVESRYLDRDAPQIKRWRDILKEYNEFQEMERTKTVRDSDSMAERFAEYARLQNARPV